MQVNESTLSRFASAPLACPSTLTSYLYTRASCFCAGCFCVSMSTRYTRCTRVFTRRLVRSPARSSLLARDRARPVISGKGIDTCSCWNTNTRIVYERAIFVLLHRAPVPRSRFILRLRVFLRHLSLLELWFQLERNSFFFHR